MRENRDNETNELFAGAPGTMLATRAMLEWTGEERWADAWRESAEELWRRRDADGLWTYPPYGRAPGASHGVGTNASIIKAFGRTGDEVWLERARRFAVHALGQVERWRADRGVGRHSLWTGDVGAALFASDCLDAYVDARRRRVPGFVKRPTPCRPTAAQEWHLRADRGTL